MNNGQTVPMNIEHNILDEQYKRWGLFIEHFFQDSENFA